LVQDFRHRAFLRFLRKVTDVAAAYSKSDLVNFRSLSSKDYPALTPVIEEYLRLAERADTDVAPSDVPRKKTSSKSVTASQMHLFDLLREKRLFSSNADLADFAGRVLPNMSRHRFDKMSRGDIAARIIEYLETRDRRTREQLESSMRAAMESGTERASDRKSFLSQWEKIIKGIEF
jgi:hypothetical protein